MIQMKYLKLNILFFSIYIFMCGCLTSFSTSSQINNMMGAAKTPLQKWYASIKIFELAQKEIIIYLGTSNRKDIYDILKKMSSYGLYKIKFIDAKRKENKKYLDLEQESYILVSISNIIFNYINKKGTSNHELN